MIYNQIVTWTAFAILAMFLFVPFVHFLIVLFYRLINRFDILLPEFSDFTERMLTPVKEIAVVQLFGGIQKMEYMNRLFTYSS